MSEPLPWNISHTTSGNLYSGHPPLLQTHYSTAIVYLFLTSLIIFIGTLGNTAIIVINVMNPKVNKIGRIFTINTAISDLCISAVAEPVCLLGAVKGESWFLEHWFVCEAVAILCFTTCVCSYLSFILQTFTRYIHICRSNLFNRIYTVPRCIGICVIIWIVSFGVDTGNLLGWSDHIFDKKTHRCSWSRIESKSFTLVTPIAILGLFLPLSTMFFLILREIFRCKKRLLQSQEEDSSRRSYKALCEAFRFSKILLVTFVMLTITWTPPGLLFAIDFEDHQGMELYLFLTWLAHVHACVVFIITFTMNNKFRDSVTDLFRLINRQRKRTPTRGQIQAYVPSSSKPNGMNC